jgi:hypothetical protein
LILEYLLLHNPIFYIFSKLFQQPLHLYSWQYFIETKIFSYIFLKTPNWSWKAREVNVNVCACFIIAPTIFGWQCPWFTAEYRQEIIIFLTVHIPNKTPSPYLERPVMDDNYGLHIYFLFY